MNQPQVGVAIIIQNSKQQILLGKRKGALGAGYYALPGGKPDHGEDLQDTARREIAEETGLDIRIISLVSVTNDIMSEYDRHFVTLAFLAECTDPTQQPQTLEPDKCEGWNWYDLDQLPDQLFPYTYKLLDNFQQQTIYPTS